MKRLLFCIFIITTLGFFEVVQAIEVAPRISDKEIIERLTKIEEGQKALNKRFDDVNRRIDDLDKKLSARIDDTNKRIEDLDKKLSARIEDTNKRIEDLDKKLSARINDLDKKLSARIEDLRDEMNKRFDDLQWMFGIYITISLVILGFVLRMLWLLHKKVESHNTSIKTFEKELEFLRDTITRLLPPKGVL